MYVRPWRAEIRFNKTGKMGQGNLGAGNLGSRQEEGGWGINKNWNCTQGIGINSQWDCRRIMD